MAGIDQVIQRISSIEERFGQKTNSFAAMPPQAAGESFAQTLEAIEKKTGVKASERKETAQNQKSKISASYNSSQQDTASLVESIALKHGVNPKLALAVAQTESNLNQDAVSPVGAVGVMQLMPDTARGLGVGNIYNREENIDGGVRYLKQMLHTFGGDVNKAVAAYNAGPGAVQNYNGIPPYKETQDYVLKVNELAR